MRRIGWGMAAALAAALAGTAPAGAVVTPDGQAIAYATNASHLPADDDATFDVYLWNRGTLELASPGPNPDGRGVGAVGISADGTRVLLRTDNALTPDDVDVTEDVFEYHAGVVTLVSTGPADTGQAGTGVSYAGASADATRVFFTTQGRMTADDTDDTVDLYRREGGVTTLVSTTPPGVTPGFHVGGPVGEEGTRILEVTDEAMVPQDTDTAPDVYERDGAAITLVSQGPVVDQTPNANGAWPADVTPDGRSVVFTSWDRLTPGDQNDDIDLYQRRDGRTLLVTARADGVSPKCPTTPLDPPRRRPPCEPQVFGQTSDGAKVLFSSPKPLADTGPTALGLTLPGGEGGLFVRTATSTTLLDTQPYTNARMSLDGRRFVVETRNQRAAGDTDGEPDLYAVEDGTWRLLSPGMTLAADGVSISDDARQVYFGTDDALVPEDRDGATDTYQATRTGPELATTGPADDLSVPSLAGPVGFSPDGDRMFFSSMRPMVAADTDDERDLYLRVNGTTELLTP